MKTNTAELTNTTLSILIETLLLIPAVPFFTGWRTRQRLSQPSPGAEQGCWFVWAGLCPRLLDTQRCAALKSLCLLQFHVPAGCCMDRGFCREPFLLEGTALGLGLCGEGGGMRQGCSCCFHPGASLTYSLCPWLWCACCVVPLCPLPWHTWQWLVPTSRWWHGCQHSTPRPSLCQTKPSTFLIPGSCPHSAALAKAKVPKVAPVPGPLQVIMHPVGGSCPPKVCLLECH